MILYTPLLPEEIFDEGTERSFVEARVDGVPVWVEVVGDGRGRIERILSTDPAHYLNPRVQPGSEVSLSL